MGLLVVGTPLTWEESKQYAAHVKEHGITQFLNIWDRLKDRHGDQLLWGDEVDLSRAHFRRTSSLITSRDGRRRSNTWLSSTTIRERMPNYSYVSPIYSQSCKLSRRICAPRNLRRRMYLTSPVHSVLTGAPSFSEATFRHSILNTVAT